MDNGIRNKIERFRIKAEEFLKENTRAFIVDVLDNYYFCEIIFVGENYLVVQDFKGLRKFEKSRIWWADVVKLEGYKDKEEK
jgi:hypothetical protein